MGPAKAEPQIADGVYATASSAPVLDIGRVLGGLLAEGGLRRGGAFTCGGAAGATSLLLALLAGALTSGAWVGVIGMPELGVEAVVGFGAQTDRLVLIPDPQKAWLDATAILLDSFDLVVLCPPRQRFEVEARRLSARARARGAVLLLVGPALLPKSRRLELDCAHVIDGRFAAVTSTWDGLGWGSGNLNARVLEMTFSGRGRGTKERRISCFLPSSEGLVFRIENPSVSILQASPSEINGA